MEELRHIPVPIHEKLAHLTKDEFTEVSKRYYSRKSRPKELCKEFNIDLKHYSSFKTLIPLQEQLDNSCPSHNVFSHQKYIDSYQGWGQPFCPVCNEDLCTELPWDYFKLKKSEQFTWENGRHPKAISSTLTFQQYQEFPLALKTFVVVWFFETPDYETYTLNAHWLDNIKICPTESMKTQYLQALQEYGLLKSNLYLLQEIALDNDLKELYKKREFLLNGSAVEYFDFWWDIALNEVIEYYVYQMKDSNFTPHLGPKTIDIFRYLLQQMSVQQAFHTIWRAVRDGERILAKNNGDYLFASNVVPGAIKKRADQILDGTIKYLNFKRTNAFKQCKLSSFFFDEMTNLGDRGFTMNPNIRYFYRGDEGSEKSMDIHTTDIDNIKSIGEILRENRYLKG